MKFSIMRHVLPLLILLALLLAACGVEDVPATGPAQESGPAQTEQTTAPEDLASQPVYTEPEAPAITFPAEAVTEPEQVAPTQGASEETVPQETVPQETVPQETYTGGPSGDENELPAIPF